MANKQMNNNTQRIQTAQTRENYCKTAGKRLKVMMQNDQKQVKNTENSDKTI